MRSPAPVGGWTSHCSGVVALILVLTASGVLCGALPAPAAPRLIAHPLAAPARPPLPAATGDGCVTGQTNDLDGQAGIEGEARVQSPCLPGQPGAEGDLTGFAFVLTGCGDGGIGEIDLCFGTAQLETPFYLFVWRSVGGLPADACGLAAYGALQLVQDEFPFFSVYDICDAHVPVAEGERIFIGAVYRNVVEILGADWFLARNVADGFADQGYVNISGKPGVWTDMAGLDLGLGNRWGVFITIRSECGGLAVEDSSWGAVKALLR